MQQLRLTCPLSAWTGEPGRCQWCNKALPAGRRTVYCSDKCRRAFEREHFWPRARATARRRGGRSCINGCDGRIEVNHIEPLVGAGYGPSCSHHQTNLEILCTACHRELTAQQRAQRRRANVDAQPLDDSEASTEDVHMAGRRKTTECEITSGVVDPRSYDAVDREWAALGLSAPARRALVNAGLCTLADLTSVSEPFLMAQHGFGPSSMPKLRAALTSAGLAFAP